MDYINVSETLIQPPGILSFDIQITTMNYQRDWLVDEPR
jgi:hypothetical protein